MAQEINSQGTIYKYSVGNGWSIDLPSGAEVLSVQYQGDVITLWAFIPGLAGFDRRTFAVYGTGWEMDAARRVHLATLQDRDGFVWHVFEEFAS